MPPGQALKFRTIEYFSRNMAIQYLGACTHTIKVIKAEAVEITQN